MIVGIVIGVVALFLAIIAGISVRIVREYQRIVLFRLGRAIGTQRTGPHPHQPGHRPHDLGRPARAVPRDPAPDGDHEGQRLDLDRLHHLLQGRRPLHVGAARRQVRRRGAERRRHDAALGGGRHAPRRRPLQARGDERLSSRAPRRRDRAMGGEGHHCRGPRGEPASGRARGDDASDVGRADPSARR